MKKTRKKKGFALLYAILLTGVITVLGLILSNIVTKQIVLSSIVRESQVAYYASDSARDCARFWQEKGFFDDDYVNNPVNSSLDHIFCSGSPATVAEGDNTGLPSFLTDPSDGVSFASPAYWAQSIVYAISDTKNVCAQFSFGQNSKKDNRNAIVSFGYNRQDCNDTSPRRVERILLSEGAREL